MESIIEALDRLTRAAREIEWATREAEGLPCYGEFAKAIEQAEQALWACVVETTDATISFDDL